MKYLPFLLVLVAGCSSGNVEPAQVEDYRKAGLPPGEEPILATPSADERPER